MSPVSVKERLVVTLRVLASGSSQKCVAASYKLGITTVSLIVSEVCQAVWKALKDEFVSPPKTMNGSRSNMTFGDFGIFPIVWGAWMESMWSSKHHLMLGVISIITKGHTPLY